MVGAIPSNLEFSIQLVVQLQSRPNDILFVEPLFQMDIHLEVFVVVRDLVMHSNPVQGRNAEIVSVVSTKHSSDLVVQLLYTYRPIVVYKGRIQILLN